MPTLLPAWPVYSAELGLDAKEPVENFDWMPKKDGEWFMDVKDALDHIEGSRDWLRGGAIDWYSDKTFDKVFALMKRRDLHSGGSVISLFSSYSACLNNWDTWVKMTKTSYARQKYKKEQLSWDELFALVCLIERMEGGGLPGSDFPQMHAEFLRLKETYQIRGTGDEAFAAIRAVWAAKKIEGDAGL